MVDEYLREIDVARMLKVKTKTLQLWRARGIGPHFFRVGRRLVRYSRDGVEAFVKGGADLVGSVS
jgi:hypothetical protein